MTASRRHLLQAAGLGAAAWLAHPTLAAETDLAKPASGKKTLKLAVATYTFRKFDLDKTLALTKQAGLDSLCLKDMHLPLTASPDQIAEAVAKAKKAGVEIYGCGVVYMKKSDDIPRAFQYAKALGVKTIVGVPNPDDLPKVEQFVKQYDIKICIHNHGPGDKVYPTPESVFEKIKNLDRRIGLCVDVGHTVRIGADLLDSIKKYADRIFDVHLKDITEASPKGRCCRLGRGVMDIPAMFRALLEINYQGVCAYEYEVDENDPVPGLAESVGYARGLLAAN